MLFQSNLRKQIRKLPKFLKFVRIIHYYSKLFTGVLNEHLRQVFGKEVDGRAVLEAEVAIRLAAAACLASADVLGVVPGLPGHRNRNLSPLDPKL